MTRILAMVRRDTNALPPNAARLYRMAGIAVATNTLLLTLALFGFHASSDPLEAKRVVLWVLFVVGCASVMAVRASHAISGLIISTLGPAFLPSAGHQAEPDADRLPGRVGFLRGIARADRRVASIGDWIRHVPGMTSA